MTDHDDEPAPPTAEDAIALPERQADALLGMPAWQVDASAPAEAPAPIATEESTPAPAPARPQEKPASPPPLVRILEAMLFIGGAPLTAQRACEIIRGLTADEFQHAIDGLNRTYRAQARPYSIRTQDGGYVLDLRPRFAGVRERLFGGVREARLSQAAVDVLSLVAYRQPATRQEIDSLRGHDSSALLRQLVRHGLVALQRGQAGDKEVYYVTTGRFLELFHLRSLDDLPHTQDLQRL